MDTSVAKDALTALETKQILEKRILQMTKDIVAFENDIMRLQAKVAENEFLSQSKTAALEETIAGLLDENTSLKAEFQSLSKIPREKLLLWALKEKELEKETEPGTKNSMTGKILRHDASKPKEKKWQQPDEGQSSAEVCALHDKCNKLEIELKENRTLLQECQGKLQLKSEEILLMQLKMKEGGTRQGKQTEQNAYILKLEDTITSLSEELSGLKNDLDSEKDTTRHRMDEMSSQLLLRHQKRFLSDRNSLIATHSKLMVSLIRMSGSFSTEIREKLMVLRGNVSQNQELLQIDIVDAIQKLRLLSWPKVTTQLSKTSFENVVESPNAISILASKTGHPDVSGPNSATTMILKKEKGFFSSLFGKVSPAKGSSPESLKSPTDKTHLVSDSVVSPSATAHLKTVFARAKGAVEANEAFQLRLSAEAHAVALAKVEEEWTAAANAKAEAEARMIQNETLAKSQNLAETSVATEAKTAAQSSSSANQNGAASSKYTAEANVAVKSEAQSANDEHDESKLRTGEQDISDVSSFSDDHDALQLEKEDSRCFNNTTTCNESVDLSQSIIAATLAMIKTQPAVILSGSREIDNVSLGSDAIPRKVYFQMEGRNRLQDRPASAEEFRTGSSQSETVKVSFLNDVVYEEAGETVPYRNRVVHNTVAEKTGRKVLAGTSKLAKDVHQLTKVRSLALHFNFRCSYFAESGGVFGHYSPFRIF